MEDTQKMKNLKKHGEITKVKIKNLIKRNETLRKKIKKLENK